MSYHIKKITERNFVNLIRKGIVNPSIFYTNAIKNIENDIRDTTIIGKEFDTKYIENKYGIKYKTISWCIYSNYEIKKRK